MAAVAGNGFASRRPACWAALLLILGWGPGCVSAPPLEGTYELVSVHGARLPVQAARTAQWTARIVGGSLSFAADGSYRQVLRLEVTTGAETRPDSTVRTGTYERRLGRLVLHAAGGDVPAQLGEGTVSVTLDSWVYVFRRVGR